MGVLVEPKPNKLSDDEMLLELVYLAPVGIIKFNPSGAVQLVNPEAARLLVPFAPDADLSNFFRVFDGLAPDLRAQVQASQSYPGIVCGHRRLTIMKTGVTISLSVHFVDEVTLMAVIQDISQIIEQEMNLRRHEYRTGAIYDHIRDHAICTLGFDGRVIEWNPTLHRIGAWRPEDVEGRPVTVFFPATSVGRATAETLLERARTMGSAEFEGWHIRQDGSRIWANTVASAIPDDCVPMGGYVLITRDMTARKQREDHLTALAATDPLTGTDNRRAGESRLKEAFSLWQRRSRVFSVLMIDCDHFKRVNDQWGHDAGDTVLIAIARLCQVTIRESDQAIRWGGEEFLILLRETDQMAALIVAERLRREIAALTIARNQDTIAVTASIGVAAVRDGDRNAADVIDRADRALFFVKENGRNAVSVGVDDSASNPPRPGLQQPVQPQQAERRQGH